MAVDLFHLEVGPYFIGGMLDQMSLLIQSLLVDGHDYWVELLMEG